MGGSWSDPVSTPELRSIGRPVALARLSPTSRANQLTQARAADDDESRK